MRDPGGVQIRSDRRHAFSVSPDELWDAMAQVDTYREWWPWLRRFEADGLEPGAHWSAVVQPPVPYRLRFQVQLREVVAPHRISAVVTGDIAGSARIEITPTPEGAELHLTSELAPTSALLRTVAQVARPMVQFGHEWVLNTGLRQFRDRALP